MTLPNEDFADRSARVPALDVDETATGDAETTVSVPEIGTHDYVCRFHGPRMLGRVVVDADATLDGGGADGTATATDSGGRGGGYSNGY
ncbi:hypothetical protein BRC79_02330 [Halobacteriales archaeon QH_8_67_27]|nr:MAG: hypothetical protein BRC79_02330 [Halobacteriales archaeon QH_8_67_27]